MAAISYGWCSTKLVIRAKLAQRLSVVLELAISAILDSQPSFGGGQASYPI